MSAFVCHPEHIAALAAQMPRADEIVKELALWNLRSVESRYDKAEGEAAKDQGFDTEEAYIAECSRLVREKGDQYRLLPPVNVLKMLRCLRYQSCEHDGWDRGVVYSTREGEEGMWHRIEDAAVVRLCGYSEAPWEYTG